MNTPRGAAAAWAASLLALFAPFALQGPVGALGAESGGAPDIHGVVRLSDPFDISHDAHVRLVSSGRALLASWESDDAAELYPDVPERPEMGWAAQFNGTAWSAPFASSFKGGEVNEAHFGRAAGAADHFLVGYNAEGAGVTVARFGVGSALPAVDWQFEPSTGSVAMRPWPAECNGRDYASALTNDPRYAGEAGRAAVLLAFEDGAKEPRVEVIARAPTLALVDAALFNWSGTLAAVLEFEPEQMAPHELLLTLRGQDGNWSAPRPVQGAAGGLSSTDPDVLVDGGRAFLAYERQRIPEEEWNGVVVAELSRDGSVREAVVSPEGGTHRHFAPDLAAMGGRVYVAWSTDDDAMGEGHDVDAYYRAVDFAAGTMGPLRPLNPPDTNATDGSAAIASDGSRLFGAWVTTNPAYLDGLDSDVVARYLEGDFDGDGLLDEVDPDPAGPLGPAHAAPPEPSQAAVATSAAVGAGVTAGVWAAVWRARKARGSRARRP